MKLTEKDKRKKEIKQVINRFQTACKADPIAIGFEANGYYKSIVHEIDFLNDIKHGTINNCTLLADSGYLSDPYQIDLFNSVQIKLETPIKSNQKGFKPYPYIFKKTRKRIETNFSQLTDQFMVK